VWFGSPRILVVPGGCGGDRMNRDIDPTPAHGTARPGVAYVIRRGPRFDPVAAARGVLRPGGEYWRQEPGQPGQWVPAGGASYGMFPGSVYATVDAVRLPEGGQWVQILIEIPAD